MIYILIVYLINLNIFDLTKNYNGYTYFATQCLTIK